jgi:hypothetical protein
VNVSSLLHIKFKYNFLNFFAKKKEQASGVSGFDLPGQDMSCGPSSAAGPDQCKESCETTPGCTHYTWFFRDGHQNCCIKDGPRSYSSLVEQPDLAPIISEILVRYSN